jgi:hypothetical protein
MLCVHDCFPEVTIGGRAYALGGHDGSLALNTTHKLEASGVWIQQADMPMGVYYHAATVAEQSVYVCGGVASAPGRALAVCHVHITIH